MQVGDIITLKIEKLNSEGDGIARQDGFVFFVKNSCPEDLLECKISKLNKNYGFATIEKILEMSKHRIEPQCKMHKLCGACSLQHIDYKYQLKLKKQILEDTLKLDTHINDVISINEGFNYRSKIQYPVASKNKSSRILAGYYQKSTHELVNIKYCPIQQNEANEIIEYIKTRAEFYQITAYNEKKHSGDLRHIVIRHSEYSGKFLVMLVLNTNIVSAKIEKLSTDIFKEYENVTGVSVNFNKAKNNVILGNISKCIIGCDYIEEKLSDAIFKISGDTFFQVNPKCANLMFGYIKDYIHKNYSKPVILDAYAGIAAFGIALNSIAKEVVSVELNPQSIKKAEDTIKLHNIKNVAPICADTLKYLESCPKDFDITNLDPPRKGCDIECLKKVLTITKDLIVYVSCNPATLARDLKFLLENGCKIKEIQPFDMFPQTPHIETVVLISTPQK